MNDIHPSEQSIEQQHQIGLTDGRDIEERPPYVASFKTGDEPMFKKPDHDPHGEVSARAHYSSTSCDSPGCETTGLVATEILEDSAGLTGLPPFDIVCSVCAESGEFDSP